jgi:hypothetical protein
MTDDIPYDDTQRKKVMCVADAALLRVLATLIEATGEPLEHDPFYKDTTPAGGGHLVKDLRIEGAALSNEIAVRIR